MFDDKIWLVCLALSPGSPFTLCTRAKSRWYVKSCDYNFLCIYLAVCLEVFCCLLGMYITFFMHWLGSIARHQAWAMLVHYVLLEP